MWRVVRGLAFVAAGVLVLVDRDAVLTLLLSALGIYLIYEGVSMILRLVYREEEHGVARPEPGPQRRVRRRRLAAGLLPAIAIIAVVRVVRGQRGGHHRARRRTAPATATPSCATGR